MKITQTMLTQFGACGNQVELFGKLYPDGLELTGASIRELHANKLDVVWGFAKFPIASDRDKRLFGCDCAERVLHKFESEFPDDMRPREAVETARNFADGKASDKQLKDAREAAFAAATIAREAAFAAATIAREAAFAAAREAEAAFAAAAIARVAIDAAIGAAIGAAECAANCAADVGVAMAVARSAERSWQVEWIAAWWDKHFGDCGHNLHCKGVRHTETKALSDGGPA